MSGDNIVFVSDWVSDCVYKLKLPKFQLVTKVGKKGNGVEEFNTPEYLTVTTDRSVLVADCYNDRIVVMDTYLKHQTMTHPNDVKVDNNKLYVLSAKDNPCLHVFSLTGEKIRSLSSHLMTWGMLKCNSASHSVSTRDRIYSWLIMELKTTKCSPKKEFYFIHWGIHRIETRRSDLMG